MSLSNNHLSWEKNRQSYLTTQFRPRAALFETSCHSLTVPHTPIKPFLAALLKSRPATSPCVIAGLKSHPDAQLCKSSQTNLRQSAAQLLHPPAGSRMEAVTSHGSRIRSSERELFLLVLLLICDVCWCCVLLVFKHINMTLSSAKAELVAVGGASRHCLCEAFCALFFLFVFSRGLCAETLCPRAKKLSHLLVDCQPLIVS